MVDSVAVDARRVAMDLLARREHSALELQRKLEPKGFAHDVVAAALDQLAADGLLSDERFAESFVRSRINKGHGPIRIKQELAQRGVSDAIIREVMSESVVNWFEQVESVALKKFGKLSFNDEREKQKCARFLSYRGFSAEHIFETIS